jgi:triacylglycerol lipase
MTYPLLLAHGVCRFDQPLNMTLGLDNGEDDSFHYFRGIRGALTKAGFHAFHSNVEWAAAAEVRARTLKKNVELALARTKAEKINIIGHSMGGLDARHMLYDFRQERIQEKVAGIATFGTPHWGSPFANWGVACLNPVLTGLKFLGLDLSAFKDLTTDACKRFNERAAEFERTSGVVFHAYVGTARFETLFSPLAPSWRIIEALEGPNDGLVSRASQRWTDAYFRASIAADHLHQTGWWDAGKLFNTAARTAWERKIQNFYIQMARALP